MKIQTGTPTKNGAYIVYYVFQRNKNLSKDLQFFKNGEWMYSGNNYTMYTNAMRGWIGPLPEITLKDIT